MWDTAAFRGTIKQLSDNNLFALRDKLEKARDEGYGGVIEEKLIFIEKEAIERGFVR